MALLRFVRIANLLVAVGVMWGLCPASEAVAGSLPTEQSVPSSIPSSLDHHELAVTLDPPAHRLVARDLTTLRVGPSGHSPLEFALAPTLHVTRLRAHRQGRQIPLTFHSAIRSSADLAGESTQIVTIRLTEAVADGPISLEWEYEGTIHDPPREPRHLRFVTPSETSGHIGVEGIYLSGESQWYPDQPGALPTFRVQITVPTGWIPVTHGRQVDAVHDQAGATKVATTTWEVPDRTEALTLVANQFVQTVREWTTRGGRTVRLETDLLPENAPLAQEYLDASARYIEAYSELLGPYPFSKFAVVENFFASGLGMPSFTLLGSGVIKRHYVQPYALGHEIVHSWIGNAVFNRQGTGNWVEGLTTYLANYYYDELSGHFDHAKEQRRLMLASYAVYVAPDADYPVRQFQRKTDQRDNAIGYQKAAMVFHLLRREVGESVFWSTIKRLGEQYRGQQLDWQDLESLFSQAHGSSLQPFFSQWLDQPGAPQLSITARAKMAKGGGEFAEAAASHELQLRIDQSSDNPFRLTVPIRVLGTNGAHYDAVVSLRSPVETVRFTVPFPPRGVQLDPDFHVMRRLDRTDLPPMLNVLATDTRRTVVLASARNGEEASVYRRIMERLTAQESENQAVPPTMVVERLEPGAETAGGSLLFLGADQQASWTAEAETACGQRVQYAEGSVTVDGTAYEGPHLALLVNCPRSGHPGHVATLFYGTTPQAAGKVARLLFFYGWQSYLVFRDGAVVGRGDFGQTGQPVQVNRD